MLNDTVQSISLHTAISRRWSQIYSILSTVICYSDKTTDLYLTSPNTQEVTRAIVQYQQFAQSEAIWFTMHLICLLGAALSCFTIVDNSRGSASTRKTDSIDGWVNNPQHPPTTVSCTSHSDCITCTTVKALGQKWLQQLVTRRWRDAVLRAIPWRALSLLRSVGRFVRCLFSCT